MLLQMLESPETRNSQTHLAHLMTTPHMKSHPIRMQEKANKPPSSRHNSLAIAKGCNPKSTLHLTDQAVMLSLMQRNTALNSLQHAVNPCVYDWGEPSPPNLPTQPEVILAADCIYFEPAFPLLLQTLQDLIGPRTVCYFACVKRRKADAQFMKAARKIFEVEVVGDDPFEEEYRGKNCSL
jgi:hypothetical protein